MHSVTLLVVGGSAIAGFVSGLAGFAFGLVAMAFWAWTISPQLIGPMLVAGSLSGQLLTFRTVRHSFDRQRVTPFILGGVIGVPIGAALLPYIDAVVFRVAVGLLLVVYCGLMLAARNLPRVAWGGRWADGGAGTVAGVLGGIAGLIGPAPTLWCMLRGWPKDTQRAVCQVFFIAMQSLTLIIYVFNGLIVAETLRMFALMIPSAVICALIGAHFYTKLSDSTFRRVLLMLLLISGVTLLSASLPQLLRR